MDDVKVMLKGKNNLQGHRYKGIFKIQIFFKKTDWIVFRTFQDFQNLDTNVKLALSSESLEKLKKIPRLKNFDIDSSKITPLEDYLNSLAAFSEVLKTKQFLEFLEFSPKNVRHLMMKLSPSDFFSKTDSNIYWKHPIDSFLDKLNQRDNKVKVIHKFQKMYFEEKPEWNKKDIHRLYNGTFLLKGLISTVGDLTNTVVVSCAALEMLANLLDSEKNCHSELFLNVLCDMNEVLLKQMKIIDHILSARSSKLDAFYVIFRIIKKYPNFLNECVADEWAKNEWAKNEFFQWCNSLSLKPERSFLCEELHQDIPKLKDLDYKEFVEKIRNDLKETLEIQASIGWRAINDMHMLRYKYDDNSKLVYIQFTTQINCPVNETFENLKNHKIAKKCCLKFKKGKVEKILDEETSILNIFLTSCTSPYKLRNTTLLTNISRTQSSSMIVFHSIESENDDSSNCEKSTFLSSGIMVESIPNSKTNNVCLLKGHLRFKDNCMPVFASDILKESDELFESINSFKELCEDRYK